MPGQVAKTINPETNPGGGVPQPHASFLDVCRVQTPQLPIQKEQQVGNRRDEQNVVALHLD
jgi:hypothetical protein